LLPGCGSGSSDPAAPGAADTTTSSTAQTGGAPGAASGAKDAGSAKGQGAPSGSGSTHSGGAGANSGPSGAQKHGPRIAQPKGEREHAPTAAEKANATIADMTLESPAIIASGGAPGALAAEYTCDGKDSWPALRWDGVPGGTAELILYAMNAAPVEGRLFIDWALAGLNPGQGGIQAGQLPKGAVQGTNSFGDRGYSICPSQGSAETYIFAVFALPKALSPKKGFDAHALREEILGLSGNVGLLPATYTRG
jgi:hypothetical protein